jgi:hypothetical protein
MCGKLANLGMYSLTYVLPLWFLLTAKRRTRTMKLSPAARNRLSQIHAYEALRGCHPGLPDVWCVTKNLLQMVLTIPTS